MANSCLTVSRHTVENASFLFYSQQKIKTVIIYEMKSFGKLYHKMSWHDNLFYSFATQFKLENGHFSLFLSTTKNKKEFSAVWGRLKCYRQTLLIPTSLFGQK